MKSPLHLIFLLLSFLMITLPVFATDKCDKCSNNGAEYCNRGNGDLLECKDHCWQKKWSCPKGQQCVMKPGPTCMASGDVCKMCHDQYNNCRAGNCDKNCYAKCHNDVCNAYDGRCKACNLQC